MTWQITPGAFWQKHHTAVRRGLETLAQNPRHEHHEAAVAAIHNLTHRPDEAAEIIAFETRTVVTEALVHRIHTNAHRDGWPAHYGAKNALTDLGDVPFEPEPERDAPEE